jgi:osmotically-inducible protein OsmY
MKSPIFHVIAAALAAGAVSVAVAQTPAPAPAMSFVQEPVATPAKPDDQLVNSIVETLNSDASLKNSKITVQMEPETGNVILTGSAMTKAQRQKAAELATAQAGEGKVINAIQTAQV